MKKNNTKVKDNNVISNKKLLYTMLIFFILFVLLIIRLIFLQFVQGASLKESASRQQTLNKVITPKRGTIYDSTGKTLAISSDVNTVTINPKLIVTKSGDTIDEAKTKEKKEKVAKAFSEIFELNYDDVLAKVNSEVNTQTIVKKVETDKISELKEWMEKENISTGINIDEDSKRTYPYNNLASNLIGVCGTDNYGIAGLEQSWNDVLTGTPGKITTSKDAHKEEIPDQNQEYIAAEDGSDLVLSIDVNIQSIVEKYLKQAVQENVCTRGGIAVAMKPSTGDILAMATYPDFNLNTPFEPNTTELKEKWDTLESSEKTNQLFLMWKNRVVSDTYEPGSTFKLITASTALEENVTGTDVANDFTCTLVQDVDGQEIHCWAKQAHGNLSLRGALQKSCNPAFMQLGLRMGSDTLNRYYDAFGFFDKTNIDLPGESVGQFHNTGNITRVDLATMAFGERITVTPIQLVTAISAIANDGVLMKPRIVKQVINSSTNTVTNIETEKVRQVISKSTAEKMRDMMQSVVDDGSGRYAQVKGYSVGGKTGTSEPLSGKEHEGYVASFVAISPTENPEICLLVALFDPTGPDGHQGGQVCGPVVSKMLKEILPELGLTSEEARTSVTDPSSSSSNIEVVTVPDIRNKTVAEAEKKLEELGFKTSINIQGDKNTTLVTNQTPKPGLSLPKDSIIFLYTAENTVSTSVTVPNLKGMGYATAVNALKAVNLNISSEGTGKVISQEIAAGESVEEGTVIKVTLHEEISDTQ